jgi:arabinose-5-phosphate isomerase
MGAALRIGETLPLDQYRLAREIIRREADALGHLAEHLPAGFDEAVQLICACKGAVIVSGIGKAGWIAQKVSATLASTGSRSHYVHPAEAAHGDLGRIGPEDLAMVFSNSGETPEVLQLLPSLERNGIPLICIASSTDNTLAQAAQVALAYGKVDEACTLGLAPSTSTTVMLALGDALALVASRQKGFRAMDFALHHPGGSLGRRLSAVDRIMRPLAKCRVAGEHETIRSIYVRLGGPARRSGAVLLVDAGGKLTGIFTDSDLARLLERQKDQMLDRPAREVMTCAPKRVETGTRTTVAIELLSRHNLSELPVVDRAGKPLGIVDITDLVGLL